MRSPGWMKVLTSFLALVAPFAGLALGCSPSFGDGDFICTDAQPGCPDGYRCIEGRCRLGSGSRDAGTDAPTDALRDTTIADTAADAPVVECPFPTLIESSDDPGMVVASIAFDTSMLLWRFEAPAGFCVTEMGVGMSALEDGASVTLALFDLSGPDEVPNRFTAPGPRHEVDVTPGGIGSITELATPVDPAFCLETTALSWWAVAAWSNDPDARPSSGHARFTGDTRQPVYKSVGGDSLMDAAGSRLFVSGCSP